MLVVLRDWSLDKLRSSRRTNLARLLVMKSNFRGVFQTEPFQHIVQHSYLLDGQVPVHLDDYSPHSNSRGHRQLSQDFGPLDLDSNLQSSRNRSISSDCYFGSRSGSTWAAAWGSNPRFTRPWSSRQAETPSDTVMGKRAPIRV